MSRTISRSGTRLGSLLCAVGIIVAVVLPAGAAEATAYRYWGYFQLHGDTWKFATKGPGQTKPADGSIEGYRFAVGTTGDTRVPRAIPTFNQVCGNTEAEGGKKRVAVVIDYGRPADYADASTKPPAAIGRCALVGTAASGAEVLGAVADVRQKAGLVCGIDNEPAAGCGDPVKKLSTAAKAPDQPVKLALQSHEGAGDKAEGHADKSSVGTEIGIAVVVLALLGLGGAALLRRRQAS